MIMMGERLENQLFALGLYITVIKEQAVLPPVLTVWVSMIGNPSPLKIMSRERWRFSRRIPPDLDILLYDMLVYGAVK